MRMDLIRRDKVPPRRCCVAKLFLRVLQSFDDFSVKAEEAVLPRSVQFKVDISVKESPIPYGCFALDIASA